MTESIVGQGECNVHVDFDDCVFVEIVSPCTATYRFPSLLGQECMDHCKMIISLFDSLTIQILYYSGARNDFDREQVSPNT